MLAQRQRPTASVQSRLLRVVYLHPAMMVGFAILTALIGMSVFAPLLATHDPLLINPVARLRPPSSEHLLGTDALGRDLWSRTVYGGRVSLAVGFSVAIMATVAGLAIGLLAGMNRIADAILMRITDGLMAIPAILLAIALMAIVKASVGTVIFAITVVEIPRVIRLVRSVVLSVREQPYVEAATTLGSKFHRIMFLEILPNTVAPLTVQATYICAAAILIESLLSFVGAGTPPEIPSWGNIIAEGRNYFMIAPRIILAPGLVLALTILAINMIGDGMRDLLDPRFAGNP